MGRAWAVIPMYNEGAVIGSVIAELRVEFPYVVCVDDGSTDDSAVNAREAGAIVLVHPINLGQGASLQTGFDFALSDPLMTEVITFDADGQHRVEDAVGMVEKRRDQNLDIVIGSRFLDTRTNIRGLKRIVLRMAATYTRITTGLPLTDAHNGLRVISRDLLNRMRLTQNRMAHASELIDHVSDLNASWTEYPTHIVYTDYSRAKGQSLWNSINILVEIIFR